MGWLVELLRGGRGDSPSAPAQTAQPTPASVQDDVPHLREAVKALVGEVNSSAGVLPSVAVVIARQITDTLMSVLAFSGGRDLSIDARIAVHGIATDYLPTTILTHTEATRVGHAHADDELIKQLSELSEAADRLLDAVRERTVIAQQSQGHFLRSKYEGQRGEGEW